MSYDPRKGGLYPTEVDKEHSNKMAKERFKGISSRYFLFASIVAVIIVVIIIFTIILY